MTDKLPPLPAFFEQKIAILIMKVNQYGQACYAKAIEDAAAFVEVQRNDIPACGFEFAAAIRALKDSK